MDEVCLLVHPVLVGDGKTVPLARSPESKPFRQNIELKLIRHREFDNGLVWLLDLTEKRR